MNFKDILIENNYTVQMAIAVLEKVRCKVVYVVTDRKLEASISDGDVRRFFLQNGDANMPVNEIEHKNPTCVYENQIEMAKEIFDRSELYSIPVVNHNNEIMAIIFRDGEIVRDHQAISLPVVIMAGGKGTRLYPYTKILPKALIPIGDIPITEHIINSFNKSGCSNFFMIVNHKKNMIEAYFDSIEKNYMLCFVEEEKPLGTGGGLGLLKDKISKDFILTNCDILIDADYGAIKEYHDHHNNFITMVVAKYQNNISYGVIDIDDEGNYIRANEKPTYDYLINTGLYIVNSQVINDITENTHMDFPSIIDKYKADGKTIGCYVVDESAYMDMGQIEELEKMKEKMNIQ